MIIFDAGVTHNPRSRDAKAFSFCALVYAGSGRTVIRR